MIMDYCVKKYAFLLCVLCAFARDIIKSTSRRDLMIIYYLIKKYAFLLCALCAFARDIIESTSRRGAKFTNTHPTASGFPLSRGDLSSQGQPYVVAHTLLMQHRHLACEKQAGSPFYCKALPLAIKFRTFRAFFKESDFCSSFSRECRKKLLSKKKD